MNGYRTKKEPYSILPQKTQSTLRRAKILNTCVNVLAEDIKRYPIGIIPIALPLPGSEVGYVALRAIWYSYSQKPLAQSARQQLRDAFNKEIAPEEFLDYMAHDRQKMGKINVNTIKLYKDMVLTPFGKITKPYTDKAVNALKNITKMNKREQITGPEPQ